MNLQYFLYTNFIGQLRQLVEQTISQLEGAFACVFKSSLFPTECVATRRGSPMVVGIKTEFGVEADSIPVHCTKDEMKNTSAERQRSDSFKKMKPSLMRALSKAELHSKVETSGSSSDSVEYFFASDASAIIEHTNKVIFLGIKPTKCLHMLDFLSININLLKYTF